MFFHLILCVTIHFSDNLILFSSVIYIYIFAAFALSDYIFILIQAYFSSSANSVLAVFV